MLADEIAERDAAIAALRIGDWRVADKHDLPLTHLIEAITSYSITEEIDRRGRPSKKADITAIVRPDQLDALYDRTWVVTGNGHKLSHRQPVVEWRGGLWAVRAVMAPRGERYVEVWEPSVEIELDALPPVRPAREQYLFGSDVETMIEHRAIGGPRYVRADSRQSIRLGIKL